MKILDMLRGRTERRAEDPSWEALRNAGSMSASGQYVDAKMAEGISAVYGCVQALSESTACLPLHVYHRNRNGDRDRADDQPLARVLREPNSYQSGMAFRESLTASVLLHGNGYARKEFNGSGDLSALHPLNPQRMTIVRLDSGRHRYEYTDDRGVAVRLLQDEVFHLRDRTDAGSIVGKSRIAVARDTLGLGAALREHGAAVFRNGARPAGVVEAPMPLTRDQVADVRDAMARRYEGAANAGRTVVLGGGLTFKPISMNLEDAQWISAQQFNAEEVCRIFRVPPTMVADLRFGSYQNTAELGSQFVRYSLARWIAMWESEIQRSLLGPIARQRYYAEHSVEGLLRGNPEARADFYQKAIGAGWMTVDEVRKLENLPAVRVSDI